MSAAQTPSQSLWADFLENYKFRTNFVAPSEIGIFGECAVPELPLEQFVNVRGQDVLEQDVQVVEIIPSHILVGQIWSLAERTHRVHNGTIADLRAKVGPRASATTSVDAVQHRHHLRVSICNISKFK